MPLVVVLAVMTLENPGGVANQITQLALQLRQMDVHPIILVRNPVPRDHVHLPLLRQQDIALFVVTDQCRQLVRRMATAIQFLAFPAVLLDAVFRHKSIKASMGSVWGVLRRLGYLGLDMIFFVQLVRSRFAQRAKVIHFRKPDCFRMISLAKHLGFRTVYSEDTIPQSYTVHFYQGLAGAMTSIDVVAACSCASARAIAPYCDPRRSIEILPHIVPAPEIDTPGDISHAGDFAVGSFSRLVPEKDIVTLLRAAQVVLMQQPAMRFLIASDGPERLKLMSLAEELGIAGNIDFLGLLPETEISEKMAGVDLVASSSLYEGMPVSLIEAMALAKPVVATAVGGVPEVVEDGVTGMLVPLCDPAALASAILAISSDRELHQRMSRAARQRYLAYFTPERVVPSYVALYQRLMI